MSGQFLRSLHDRIKLRGDENEHEQTDRWCNRDLIPLPPKRRTWGLVEFYGYFALMSFGVVTWQTPAAFLTTGLSVGQTMAVVVASRAIIVLWLTLIGYAGATWHIGFMIQNRYSWGMKGSYLPLLQRVLLNFIWNAVQCWNGGKLAAVCITAIFSSFAAMENRFPESVPMTTYEFVGFVIFWTLSLPLLLITPEKFRRPFQFITVYCFVCSFALLIWSLATAKGVGSLWNAQEDISGSRWSIGWVIVSSIVSSVGSTAAGMTNGSDFSRYGKDKRSFIWGAILCYFVTGVSCSLIGLVTTAACQIMYGELLWNPPDLLMRIMDSGRGSSGSRAAVFFLALGFGTTSMVENMIGNCVAGGIDLAGTVPRYINIRRGAFITFIAAWICQPWQLVNRASTFIQVMSSFSVFLAPSMGIMATDYYIIRKQKIKLSALYQRDGCYSFWHGVNLRAFPAWIIGWAPTVPGLALQTSGIQNGPAGLYHIYFISFFYCLFSSAVVFYVTNLLFPPTNSKPGSYDEDDIYGTFTFSEGQRLNVNTSMGESVDEVDTSDHKDSPDVSVTRV